jgi:hypothetical protein
MFLIKKFLDCKTLNFASYFLPEIVGKKVILHEWSEQSECSEVKGIKKGIKIFHPSVYGWMGGHVSVRIKKLNNF